MYNQSYNAMVEQAARQLDLNLLDLQHQFEVWSNTSGHTIEELLEYAYTYYWEKLSYSKLAMTMKLAVLVISAFGLVGGFVEILVLRTPCFKTPSFLYLKLIIYSDVIGTLFNTANQLMGLFMGSNPSSLKFAHGKLWSCQFFPYNTKARTLQEFFENITEIVNHTATAAPWYIGWSNCHRRVSRVLRQHYATPDFLPLNSMPTHVDWLFMGSPGYGAKMHVDDVRFPSWQAQIRGSKLWRLRAPPECIYECGSRDWEVVLNPGAIIVVDTNYWYHQTFAVGQEISIALGNEYD